MMRGSFVNDTGLVLGGTSGDEEDSELSGRFREVFNSKSS